MKIAQVAPLAESVPPKLYGGTERIVSYLTEELVNLDHEVSLFASGDSITSARLIAHVPEALRLKKDCEDMLAPHIVQLKDVIEMADEFDIIHFHTDYLNFFLEDQLRVPHITTLHGKLTIPELQFIYNKFPHQPLVSISNAQRKPLPQANFVTTVYHGLPRDLLMQGNGEGGYFAFIGRISPEKRCDRAIEIAIATHTPIKIAAKIDKVDRNYFDQKIKHLFDHPLVNYIGEIDETQKQDFLGNAKALLFPIDWPEPFGLVIIEAMACGTPVIAWNNGSVPEIIEEGKAGFIVNAVDEAVAAVNKLFLIKRNKVRKVFEERFTARRMALNYIDIYQRMIQQNKEESGNGKSIAVDFTGDRQPAEAV
jgi:glycosyltransferase involved in cell wall biosynthesis